jgi:chloramphenicol-sensitive protein RarD
MPSPSRASDLETAARRTGVLASLSAYTSWGLFPLYFKALRAAPSEVLVHRIVWSALFLTLIATVQRRWSWLARVARTPRLFFASLASATLLSINWFIYIWAVGAGRVVDASLGYFITPLLSVLFGVVLLGERLRRLQWLSLAIAALGVVWLTWEFGQLPWVGLSLAASFGTYAALRKTAQLGAFEGLALETWILCPLALGYLLWLGSTGQSQFVTGTAFDRWALLAAGPITSIPLLLFAAGARRIPLSLAGVLQYVSPTLQLSLGVLVWHEPFDAQKRFGYALIWLALALYSGEGLYTWRRATASAQGTRGRAAA